MPELKIKFAVDGIKELLRAFRTIGRRARRLGRTISRSMRNAGRAMRSLARRAAYVGVGFGAMLGLAARAAGKFEMLKLRLQVVTGSAEKAEKAFKAIFALSTKTPFEPDELVEAAILLRAFGQEAQSALVSVAQAAASMDRPIKDIATAIGSMETEPLRRLGIEISRAGDKATVTFRDKLGREVTRSAKGIDNIRKLILDTFSAKFGGGLELASQTLFGKFSTLRGNVTAAFAEVGNQLLPIFKLIIDSLNSAITRITENGTLKNLGSTLKTFAINFGAAVLTMSKSWNDLANVMMLSANVVKEAIREGFVAGGDAIKSKIEDAWKAFPVAKIPGAVKGGAKGAAEGIKNIFRTPTERKRLAGTDDDPGSVWTRFKDLFRTRIERKRLAEQNHEPPRRTRVEAAPETTPVAPPRRTRESEIPAKQHEQRGLRESDFIKPLREDIGSELDEAIAALAAAIKGQKVTLEASIAELTKAWDDANKKASDAVGSAAQTFKVAKKGFVRGIDVGDLSRWEGPSATTKFNRLQRDMGHRLGTFGKVGSFKTKHPSGLGAAGAERMRETLAQAKAAGYNLTREERVARWSERTAKAVETLADKVKVAE